jgi:predicted nucleotidyltransferase
MKSLSQMVQQQKDAVADYRSLAYRAADSHLSALPGIVGVLLTGSAARGDARKGPYGLHIDLSVVVADKNDIDLTEIFGPSVEPYSPYHCVDIEGQIFAIEVVTLKELIDIRTRWEPVIFAKQESVILFDRTGLLTKWKKEIFSISDEQMHMRAMQQYFRYDYLTNDYRTEKWKHREAWMQMAQNGNEAIECYCNFLYCINGWFIPRKDWLVYLTYELPEKAPEHEELMTRLYKVEVTRDAIVSRGDQLQSLGLWMRHYCERKGWLTVINHRQEL